MIRISEGSHHILRKPGNAMIVVVPVHGSRDVPRATFQSILRQAGLKADQFFDMFEADAIAVIRVRSIAWSEGQFSNAPISMMN